MDISLLKQELIDNKVRPLYIFTGDELALQDIYIDKIKQITGYNSYRVDYLNNIYSRLSNKTLFKTKPNIYIIRNDEQYLNSESSWEKILKGNFNGNIVILLYTGIENNSKFYKFHENVSTRFDFIGTNLLVNRLVATTNMPKNYCQDLVKICGNNYGRIKNELYKLNMLGCINKCSLNNAYLKARKSNFIHEDIGDIIFEFTDSIVLRKIALAYELLPKINSTDEGNLKILSVLYNSFRQILMVQCTLPNDRTEDILGLSKAQIYVCSQRCNIYNSLELVKIIKTIRYLEKGIKVGTVDEKYSIDYLLSMIW